MKEKISFDEFIEIEKKLEICVGKILNAELVPKSNGLKLTIKFGENEGDIKTAFTNLGKTHTPEQLIGITCPFIMNLEPSVIKGVTSEVMIVVGKSLNDVDEFENYSIGSKLL